MSEIKYATIKPGDRIQVEYSGCERREYLELYVSHSLLKNGRGVAVFHDGIEKTYLWKPAKDDPHGSITYHYGMYGESSSYLSNPQVRVYRESDNKFVPVYSRDGTYIIK